MMSRPFSAPSYRIGAPLLALALALGLSSPAIAQSTLKPELAGIAFLVGDWSTGAGTGKVIDTGGTSTGSSHVTIEADGGALLRRDHTQTFDKNGKPAGGFSQLMMIYSQGGTIRADYEDGEGHVIHYTSAKVTPGKSVTFSSAPDDGAVFQLTYEFKAPDTLAITFGLTPRGTTVFHPIATGTLTKTP
jgi:hypothetical protein